MAELSFSALLVDRALVCRDRGIKLIRTGDRAFDITLRLLPREAGEPHRFTVWKNALKRDHYLARLLDRLTAGEWPVTKATLQFERPGRKVVIRLSYQKPIDDTPRDGVLAAVMLDDAGFLYVTCEGQELSLAAETHRLRHMKEHFAGIHERLRRCLGTRRRRHRHRQALLQAGCFEKWSEGPVHHLSRGIANWCRIRNVSRLEWKVPVESGLPSAKLRDQVAYKGEEFGMTVSKTPEPSEQE